MGNFFHFLGRRGEFGAAVLKEDGAAVVFVPSVSKVPFHWDAAKIAKYSKDASGDERAKTWHGIQQWLALNSVRMDEASLQEPVREPGQYCPRIWRGIYNPSDPLALYSPIHPRETYGAAFVDSTTASGSLLQQFADFFRHVEPSRANDVTYSHRIRELLLLACTELEASWRGVLRHNLKDGLHDKRPTTNDYVRLLEPLRLREWSVELADYPDYGTIRPFEEWSASAPTKTLLWYESYHAVKHDREARFASACFGNLVKAMAALHVELAAQWGPMIFDRLFDEIPSPYRLRDRPSYAPGELYSPCFEAESTIQWCSVPWFSDQDGAPTI